MNSSPKTVNIAIRSLQYKDLDAIERLAAEEFADETPSYTPEWSQQLQRFRHWYGPLKFLSLFPNPCQHALKVNVAEQENQILGSIHVAPFNRTRSTWKVEQVLVSNNYAQLESQPAVGEIGSLLLRHCFESIWEARTWLLEVNIHNKTALALYRQNGFQPLAQMTYWAIAPEMLQVLAEREPDLPNLLPVSNADAQLLYQLDTVSMPPLVRQVYDRHISDFRTPLLNAFLAGFQQWFNHTETLSGYVFEPQRKAAIGYFQIKLCRNGSQPHTAQLTVHPAYTWLYPELLSKMAGLAKHFPPQALHLGSTDYQAEREEYLEQIGAERIDHTLLMSRSVWHKLRETKPVSLEGLQIAEMLQSLQPARKPIPSRIELRRLHGKKSSPNGDGATNRKNLRNLSDSITNPANSLSQDAAPPAETPNSQKNGHSC
jgi:hypothetical protein